jgi:protein ImuB
VDGHRPERFALVEYTPPPPPEVRREPRNGRGLLAVRVLRPPLGLEVIGQEQPQEVRTIVSDESEKRPRIEGPVKVASGPWGLEEGWWTEDPVGREYWDVELAGGGIYRIYRDRASGEWFADGIYD